MFRNIKRNQEYFSKIFKPGCSIIIFDTETTGLGKNAKIIEFGAVRFLITTKGLKETGKMDLFINPEETLSERIIEITGITDDILERAKNETIEAPAIFNFLESADFWGAYNCAFDLRMLEQMSYRTGIHYHVRECIDILEMARDHIDKAEIENYKLQTITEYLFPNETGIQYHKAIDDVRATAKCMAHFVGLYKSWKDDSDNRIQTRLNWAAYCINPQKKSQIRIKLNLPVGEYGDIFWDVIAKSWSHKSTTSAKKLFERLDLINLEEQVLKKYAWKYHVNNMTDLAKAWGETKKLKDKEKDVS